MHKISTGLSVILVGTVFACLIAPPNQGLGNDMPSAPRKSDVSATGIDFMPVGTANQMARVKRVRSTRKA